MVVMMMMIIIKVVYSLSLEKIQTNKKLIYPYILFHILLPL